MKKKTCMLIPQLLFPIPAVRGGAIETLITNLIIENEKRKELKFVVVSTSDDMAEKEQYQNTKIYYFDDFISKGENTNKIRIKWKCYSFFRHFIQNRITHKLFGFDIPYMDFLTYQYYMIAKKEKGDFISIEGDENEENLRSLSRLVGKKNIYNHIHYVRQRNDLSRKWIPNSISISDFVRKTWTGANNENRNDVVLYNGIDIERFRVAVSEKERNEFREKLGILKDEFVVIYCGRIMPEKGLDVLMRSFKEMPDKRIKLLFVGGIPEKSSRYFSYAENYIEKILKMNNVIFCGYVSNEELPIYYKSADIQIIPSVWQEGAGLVAIEGMASGLPQIVTMSGGMTEYISDNNAIILPIDADLDKRIIDAILYIKGNEKYRIQMGINGQKNAQRFSRESYYKGFVDIVYERY